MNLTEGIRSVDLSSAARDGNDELLRRVRVREPYNLDVDETGGLPRLHHVALRHSSAPLRPDYPDGSIAGEQFPHRREALQIVAGVGRQENRIETGGAA